MLINIKIITISHDYRKLEAGDNKYAFSFDQYSNGLQHLSSVCSTDRINLLSAAHIYMNMNISLQSDFMVQKMNALSP